MIARVISGGQDGLDIAGVRVAKRLGILTGGTMPNGWLTHSGPHPEYEELYSMLQSISAGYANRTDENVRNADATLRIAVKFHSPGELCTERAIKRHKKPCFNIELNADLHIQEPLAVQDAVAWIRAFGKPIVLNVAGNSERTARGIEQVAEVILGDIFFICGRFKS